MEKIKFLRCVVFFLLAVLILPAVQAQEKGLESSFANTVANTGNGLTRTDKLPSTNDNVEMLRQTLTLRGANNALLQLEYFFPQLVAPMPFNITGGSSQVAPKDFVTSVLVPEVKNMPSSEKNNFEQMPSVDNLVKNAGTGAKQGQQTKKQTQQQNQAQNKKQNQKQASPAKDKGDTNGNLTSTQDVKGNLTSTEDVKGSKGKK